METGENIRHTDKAKGRGKVLEKDIQREICEWLREQHFFFWRSNNVPVFSKSNDGVRRFRSLPKDTPRGLPDIMVVEQGKFIAIEVKRPGMKLRPEQAEYGTKLVLAGGVYLTVHSLNELALALAEIDFESA